MIETLVLFSKNFHLTDVLDILIISFLIYSTLFLFKQTRSFLVVVGIGIVTIIYVVAKTFELYLTLRVLQSFFGVFLIAIVIIFQEELRRFFSYLAEIGTRRIKIKSYSSLPVIREISEAIQYLSHNKMGAIIVLPGREKIARYISGGNSLDGIISDNILLSIFDPNSPGHDGAVIVEGNRISQFGAHLPLSQNFVEIGKRGTRHSAAVGISEKSDALALVVSEESGEISYAQYGKLEKAITLEDLNKKIESHMKVVFPERSYGIFEDLIKKNSIEKIIAIAIAFILWFLIVFLRGR